MDARKFKRLANRTVKAMQRLNKAWNGKGFENHDTKRARRIMYRPSVFRKARLSEI